MRQKMKQAETTSGLDKLIVEKDNEHQYERDLNKAPQEDKERMLHAGIDPSAKEKSGTFLMRDQSVVHCNIAQPGLELISTQQALEKYDGLKKYWWQLLSPDTDQYTGIVKKHDARGYFIRVAAGKQVTFPVQTCLFLEHPGRAQAVHNVIIAEEGASVDIITGCTANKKVDQDAAHLGVSEIYIEKDAQVTYSMIHNWNENIEVRPRTGVRVAAGGSFTSNYISLKAVKNVQMSPLARLVGKGANASFNSILVAPEGAHLDIGSRVMLEAEETRTEIISKALTMGGEIISRGLISGSAPRAKGHLECQGLVLNNQGRIYTVPELDGRSADVELSHEAAVGKVDQAEIEYLMARGLTEAEAISVIVRGFLSAEIKGLPEILQQEINSAVDKIQTNAF